MAQIIKVGCKPEDIQPKNGRKFDLDEALNLIGGWVQCIRLGHGNTMLVDEEGLLKHRPLNYEASKITGFPIVGTAIVCRNNEF